MAKSKVSHSGHGLVLTASVMPMRSSNGRKEKRKQKGVCEHPNKEDTIDWLEGAVVRRPA